MTFCSGTPIPTVEYTAEEKATWKVIFNKLTHLYKVMRAGLIFRDGIPYWHGA
jgi:hypothetical protein